MHRRLWPWLRFISIDAPAEKPLAEEAAPPTPPAKLDIASLDLTIEEVEERISPSETNVFDK